MVRHPLLPAALLAALVTASGCAPELFTFEVAGTNDCARAGAACPVVATAGSRPVLPAGVHTDAALATALPVARIAVALSLGAGAPVEGVARGGRIALLGASAAQYAGCEVVGGRVVVRARLAESGDERACDVVEGSLVLRDGRTVRVAGGSLALAGDDGAWTLADASVRIDAGAVATSAEVAPEVRGAERGAHAAPTALAAVAEGTYGATAPATVLRIAVRGQDAYLGSGTVRVVGAPDGAADLEVIDGDVALDGGARGRCGCSVRAGGVVLLGTRGGQRRFRATVSAGRVTLGAARADIEGRMARPVVAGELTVTVTLEGGESLALVGAVPLEARPVTADARSLGALDALIEDAPDASGGRVRLRLAQATEYASREPAAGGASFYAVPLVGRTVVFVLDVSESMRDADPAAEFASLDAGDRPRKLDVARAELVRALASLPEGTRVDIVVFSAGQRTLWAQPRALDNAALGEAVRWIAALGTEDETHPLDAMRAACAMGADQVVVLTDGDLTDARDEQPVLLGLAAGVAARGGRVDAVGVGPDQDTALLDAVAARGRGAAVHR